MFACQAGKELVNLTKETTYNLAVLPSVSILRRIDELKPIVISPPVQAPGRSKAARYGRTSVLQL